MPDLSQTLNRIAQRRRADPLAPVTVVVPSHLAGLQLRRRLGAMGPFAAVRFETLPRLAEILAGGHLARSGRTPLARPIGDYLAAQVAQGSRESLAGVRDLPGFGRVLRQLFTRLRRGGIARPDQVRVPLSNGYMGELLRLYGEFRTATSSFYDEEDLLDAAAAVLRTGPSTLAADLGEIYVAPPGPLSAGAQAFAQALRASAGKYSLISESAREPSQRFVLAPDPASEAREAVREVMSWLDAGAGLHEVAIFHGADRSYARLLREAFDAAGAPVAMMPGIPLVETPAGKAVLALASLPDQDYSRTGVLDFLMLAPLRRRIPASGGDTVPTPSAWDRLSRDAGVTKGHSRWQSALRARLFDLRSDLAALDADSEDWRRAAAQRQIEQTEGLQGVIDALIARLEPLRQRQGAASFIEHFQRVVGEYIDPAADALDKVKAEIEQLGTVAQVGGQLALAGFVHSLRANLEIASDRRVSLGDGVLVADYRVAAGLDFKHVVLCGAYEGSIPAGPGGDTLVADSEWAALRQSFPFIEDADLRSKRASEAALRAVSSAGELVWSAPLFEPGGAREYYPSAMMVRAAAVLGQEIRSGSALRAASPRPGLRRAASPLAASLVGPAVDPGEAALRMSVREVNEGVRPGPGHRLHPPLTLLRSRRSPRFTEFDGNLVRLAAEGRLSHPHRTSPTALEAYSACGFQYFGRSILRLNVVEEPEERDVMDPAERGSLVHDVLDEFFRRMQTRGRPRPYEAWGDDDRRELLEIAELRLEEARQRGKSGLDIFSNHDNRTILLDLLAFLDDDSEFRAETGAMPWRFEVEIPAVTIAGVEMRGRVDRIDRTPDGSSAWVIDYKTGAVGTFRGVTAEDPFDGGHKLQLPSYVAATDAANVEALYWFITRKGNFERIPYDPKPANQQRFQEIVAAILGGIERGAFPAVSGDEDEFNKSWANCRFCDYTRICSVRRDPEFHAKAEHEDMLAWLQVGKAARGDEP